MPASLWSELEDLGREVGTKLEYGPAAKLVLLTFAAENEYHRSAEVVFGWDIEAGTDPTTGADGFWFTLPVGDPVLLAKIYDSEVIDVAMVTSAGQVDAPIFHIIRKVPAITEPREARIFTQFTDKVWDDNTIELGPGPGPVALPPSL